MNVIHVPPAPGTRTSAPRLALGPLGITVRVVVAIGILIIANLVPALATGLLVLVPGASEIFGGSSPWGFGLAVVLQSLVLGTVVLGVWGWMNGVERAPLRATGWSANRLSAVWLLLGIALSAGTVVVVTALIPADDPVRSDSTFFHEQTDPVMICLLIAYALGLAFLQQGIPEELLFRGMLLWRLRGRPVLAVAVTTLAFTLIHLVSNGGQQSPWEHVLYLALPFGFALLAVGLLLWTGSLWAAVGVHGGFHVGTVIAGTLLPPVTPATSWLAIGSVQSVIGITLIVTALRKGRRIPDGTTARP
ncbi:CPBP family intramembrane glutamic endopeptidase [Microbacterium sp. NPDC086615]|jgi:membrane protease YdiL (CAAX protease family)|uniref:CPBP family intramembrane glutamic endopeptidase n=1 Tax=Microbacterium sp. NPDC086615 TaxID=3154865 RepID=UPI003429303B